MAKSNESPDLRLEIEDSGPQAEQAPETYYKATVRLRWHNWESGTRVRVEPGTVVTFDAGDFNRSEADHALVSLADVLARGLFVPWDPEHAGDPDYMSRDEMLLLLNVASATTPGGEPWAHNTDADTLREAVRELLAPKAPARPRRGGEGA